MITKRFLLALSLVLTAGMACSSNNATNSNEPSEQQQKSADSEPLQVAPTSSADQDGPPPTASACGMVRATNARVVVGQLVDRGETQSPPCDGTATHPFPYVPISVSVSDVLFGPKDTNEEVVQIDIYNHHPEDFEHGTSYLVSYAEVNGHNSNIQPVMQVVDAKKNPASAFAKTTYESKNALREELLAKSRDFMSQCQRDRFSPADLEQTETMTPANCR